jgi:hypothetical protein
MVRCSMVCCSVLDPHARHLIDIISLVDHSITEDCRFRGMRNITKSRTSDNSFISAIEPPQPLAFHNWDPPRTHAEMRQVQVNRSDSNATMVDSNERAAFDGASIASLSQGRDHSYYKP